MGNVGNSGIFFFLFVHGIYDLLFDFSRANLASSMESPVDLGCLLPPTNTGSCLENTKFNSRQKIGETISLYPNNSDPWHTEYGLQ